LVDDWYTYTALFEALDYDVVFDANGGEGAMANQTITFDTEAALSANAFTRTGYSFAEWNTAADGSGTAYANSADFTMEVEGETLYAQWTANNYDVVFNANNGEGTMANQIIAFDATAALAANAFTRTDYAFAAWNTSADGSGTTYANGADFTMDVEGITLYAQWDEASSIKDDLRTSLKIYPNPASNELTISNLKQGTQLMLFDAVGSIVLQQQATATKTTLNVSSINSGVYFIRVDDYTTKIIIE
jgi:hypothetical protein